MAHMIEIKANGAAQMVSTGKEWHYSETGHPILPPAVTPEDFQQWKELSGLAEVMTKTPVFINVGSEDSPIYAEIPEQYAVKRESDNRVFSFVTDQYKIFQPSECIDFLKEFVSADERFSLQTAGTLKHGAVVWAMFGFSEDMQVMGEPHKFNLLATTSFDGTMSTLMQGTTTRVVCNNTLQASQWNAAGVKVGHRTEWTNKVKEQAKRQLEQVLQSQAQYKALAEALAGIRIGEEKAKEFLSQLIFTPELKTVRDAKTGKDVSVWTEPSTKASNNIDRLLQAYDTSKDEVGGEQTGWTLLNAVTRYADHEMGIKKRDGKDEQTARLESQLLGTASKFKAEGLKALFAANDLDMRKVLQAA